MKHLKNMDSKDHNFGIGKYFQIVKKKKKYKSKIGKLNNIKLISPINQKSSLKNKKISQRTEEDIFTEYTIKTFIQISKRQLIEK